MAIIKLGPPIAGIRGTIGGITFSENMACTYAKLWSRGPNPRTPKQSTERSFLSDMPILWNALSDAQRDAWRAFAADPAQEKTNALAEAYYASGYNWFCTCNVRLFRVGRADIQNPPAQARPAAPTIDDFRICLAGDDVDEATGGAAAASTVDPLHLAADAFDDSLVTYWATLIPNTIGWIQYTLPAPLNIKRYRIYPVPAMLTAAPANWIFQVHDGAAWQDLHTVIGEAYGAAQWFDYYCPNTYSKTVYRLNVTQNQGHANQLAIAEIELCTADNGQSVIIYPEDNFDDAPNYDLVLHISQGRSIGMGVQYPGFREILADQTPGRWHATFQSELTETFGTVPLYRSWFTRLYRQTQEGLRSAAATDRTTTIGG